jgi:beta-lactamase superfamily II metal-dependent hydrolase
MILKVFDVDQGSCNFIKTNTGKTELVDFGGKLSWSPVQHIYNNYIERYGQLDRLVLTHHHGDHLKDIDSFGTQRPKMVVRRKLEGDYLLACRRSNTPSGQKAAEYFSQTYDSWNGNPDNSEISDEAWGASILSFCLSYEDASNVSSTDSSIVNNCSYVRLYNHNGTKILLAGDMEKEGMSLLLSKNPIFRSKINGVNVLIAPHHGHRSGFCTELFDAMGQVNIVISSMMSGDNYVDTRYSDSQYVKGIPFDDGTTKKLLTTRTHGAMTVESRGNGNFHITINQQ